jgi:Cell Wall Hydrolase
MAVLVSLIGLAMGAVMARPPAGALALRARLGLVGAPPLLRGAQDIVDEPATSAARAFVLPAASALDRERATRCLADAVYYEAALEPIEGQRAVAQVVLNRMRDPNFPKSVCGVVYDGWKNPPGCQFSFACDGSMARPPVAGLYRNALEIAAQALAGHVEPEVGWATHYHATSVSPAWRADLVRVAQVGSQIFYRWPGAAGRAEAFTGRYGGGEQVPPAAELAAVAKAAPTPAKPLPVDALSVARPLTDGPPVYLYGRRMRSRAEIQQMNQLLEQSRSMVAGAPSLGGG